MEHSDKFKEHINLGYTFKKDSFIIGTGMLEKEALTGAQVKIPLKTLNRHGLIAGATGTGKTKTLQVIAEQLSLKGIPSVLMDLKGDLTGLACPGTNNEHIEKRSASIGIPYEATGLPVELMSISQEKGVKLKATVSEFGPVLMAQILDLNDTQSGILSLVFRYCDMKHLPLLDLMDLRSILKYVINEGKAEITKEFGAVSSSSVNTILRKIIELEQQGAENFYGERSFEVEDFVRQESGRGVISIIRLTDIQNRPKLFSTFMLSLLSEIYETFPEQGDQDVPKLCLFIDEAHLVFSNASKDLLEKIEAIVKLIRSKGVGIFFCTQSPTDVPDEILGQLGLKVQHSLRAFTAKDRKAIKKAAENYPISPFYDTSEVLTAMGIGEALITVLNEKGIPTPLVHTLLRAPVSRMGILSPEEIDLQVGKSNLTKKYNEPINRESAFEILEEKINNAAPEKEEMEASSKSQRKASAAKDVGFFESLSKNTMVRQLGRTFFRELTRGIMGSLTNKKR
ncbi:helicase HerA-like domain-containing protein [Cyclobacterium amurskyense]|uniref:Putative ATPase n=1 Tax=Cyclobacterium amurskyense TaxID=320787 RepID=A0A0H4PGD9_9BACT|nr:helicase HerA-like domain-containing protein [Cyclobacterium amurskyense]AKP53586.1 Putative ATPase [Cyclobacterium amurskyense]|tara:strand:+ start:2783 stop:4315 length:1533 start_codon:yes stop_codon:yes gene_type:complete